MEYLGILFNCDMCDYKNGYKYRVVIHKNTVHSGKRTKTKMSKEELKEKKKQRRKELYNGHKNKVLLNKLKMR